MGLSRLAKKELDRGFGVVCAEQAEHRGRMEVEVRLSGWRLAEAFSELRVWLDHHQCIPESFEITKPANGALLVRIAFVEDALAERFKREFGDP
jgi:hypothetical protein